MDKIYIVSIDVPYEFGGAITVFSTEQKANEFLQNYLSLPEQKFANSEYYSVDEYEVDANHD